MRILLSYSMVPALAFICLGSGCATGIYDSVFDGLNKIAAVHLKSGKPIEIQPSPWRNREPGNTYGHEEPTRSVKQDVFHQKTLDSPSFFVASNPPRRLPYGNNPSCQSGASAAATYNQGLAGSSQVPPATSSPGCLENEAVGDVLERQVWEHYRRFEFAEVFTKGTPLAGMPGVRGSQRAMAFILMGSVACIQGRLDQARDYFRNAILADPARTPDPAIFPSVVCRVYQEVAVQCTQGDGR